tara:strand:+ start:728 stop:1483 length:756 start_codon:yes stop_codon:yes gene_type:complete
MIALVDADSLIYKVGFAIEDKVTWNEMEVSAGEEMEAQVDYYTNLVTCYKTLDSLINSILLATGCDEYLLVFTGANNFRKTFPISYKANRKSSRKPSGFEEIFAYARKQYNTITVDGIEADDYVVYLKTKEPEDYILCAIDKDVLNQTVGTHYNYATGEEVTTRKHAAIWFAYFQTLTGDTTDGYKGCPQIGKVKADAILDDLKTEKEMWEAVVAAYESKGLDEEEAMWNMRLANMHQYNGKEVILWTPPT